MVLAPQVTFTSHLKTPREVQKGTPGNKDTVWVLSCLGLLHKIQWE